MCELSNNILALSLYCRKLGAVTERTYEVIFHDVCRCNRTLNLCRLANFFSKSHSTNKVLDSGVDRLLWILVLHVLCISHPSKTEQ